MADGHLGYSVPVGGVVAYRDFINVNGVGFDIACGNKAVRLDIDADTVKENIYRTMNEVQRNISFAYLNSNNLYLSPLVLLIGIIYALQYYQPQSWWVAGWQNPVAELLFGALLGGLICGAL